MARPHAHIYDFDAASIAGQPAQLATPARQGAADRQHREQVRLHAAVRRPRGALEGVPRPGPRRHRLSEQPVRRPGPGRERRDRLVLRDELRRHVPDDGQGRRQRRQGRSRSGSGSPSEAPGILGTQPIKWNFTKFLVGKDGQVIKRFAPNDSPQSLKGDIEKALAACAASRTTMFEHVEPFGGDPILSLNEDFQKDPRPRQDQPVDRHLLRRRRAGSRCSIRCAAPKQQVVARDAPKPYLPIEGAANFRSAVQALLFGADHEALASGRVATIQSVGSSGGLKVGADFIARWLPGSEVWVSDPSWENHRSMFEGAGLAVHNYPYYDAATGGLAFDAMCAALRALAGQERRAAARLLPQPDRRRPDAGAVGRAGADPGRARAAAVPRPRLPGLRRRHRRGRLRACARSPRRAAATAGRSPSSSPTRSPRA